MGKLKKYLIEFDENHSNLEYGSDKYFFELELWFKLHIPRESEIKSDVREFFNDIFPELNKEECIWCMASSSNGTSYNFSYGDREQALIDLSILANENVNLYFSPAIFLGWRKDVNVSRIHTIYIDIDDIDSVDFSGMNETEIKEWLCDTYTLTEEVLPNWIVASGHGLHLYWIVNEINLKTEQGAELRKIYTDYLITYFKADIACRNKSRILRFPTSRNVKHIDDIRSTRLFRLNKLKNKDIRRLDFFRCSVENVETYMSENIKRRSEKRKATMIKNGTWKERKSNVQSETVKADKEPSPARRRRRGRMEGYIPGEKNHGKDGMMRYGTVVRGMITAPLSPKSRYLRIIRDLQNYSIRCGTVPEGYRAIFSHIMSVYCKKAKISMENAEKILYNCLDEYFLDEAKKILTSVYNSKTEYTYTNEHIAELLNFKPCDLKDSYAYYTEEQRKEAQKRVSKRYDDKRYSEKRKEKAKLKQYRRDFISQHMDMTAKELSEMLKCSERTIRYIKADIRKEG